MTTDAPNTTTNKSEKKRGYEEGGRKIELLRAKWPKAFPAKSHDVRPLTNGAQQAMVEEFGWSPGYARAVLRVWKLRPAYCKAILLYPTRINLDGSPSGEEIDDAARATATKRLEERAARQARKLANLAETEQEQRRLPAAAKESTQAQAPESAPASIPSAQPESAAPPEPLKSDKPLVAGSAAMQAALKRRMAGGMMTTEEPMMGTEAPMMGTAEAMMTLKPGVVAGENAACTSLRAEVETYLYGKLTSMMK